MARRLTIEETKKCLLAWREYRDKDALTVLVECNQPLVKYFAGRNLGKGLSFDELVSAGNYGLLNAIYMFDYRNNEIEKFSSYISVAIDRTMKTDIRKNNKHSGVMSFEDPILGEDEDLTIEDILGTDEEELFDNVISELKIDIVREALNKLSYREQQIILLRYGLDDKHRKSQEEVAKIIGCSKQNISFQEQKALTKMRHPRITRKLKDFID